MPTRGEIKSVIDTWSDWLKQSVGQSLPRQQILRLPKKQALALIGVRRCGKSYTAANLCGASFKEILCINFEDPFFIDNNTPSILDDIISVYIEYQQTKPQILLFDEIYHIQGWERWIRKTVDLNQYPIVLTGSSAQMLSSELATSLTGRCLTKTIWPISFKEFLDFKKKINKTANEHLASLREYMTWGGFPDVVLEQEETEKKLRLQQYLGDILYKDIVKRYQIRTPRSLEQIVHYYLTNTSSLHSYNSVRKAFNLNTETVGDYTYYCQMCFLIFEVARYHRNLKVQSRDPKKIYAIDTGLRNANTNSFSEDRGSLAENTVFIELKRRGCSVYYFKETGEVDFLVVEGSTPVQAIQVCYDNLENEKTRTRETSSLLECLNSLNLKEGLILTLDVEDTETVGKKQIKYLPLYKWLLDSKAE